MIEERYLYVGTQMGRIEAKVVACFLPFYTILSNVMVAYGGLGNLFLLASHSAFNHHPYALQGRQPIYLKRYESQDT